MCRVYYFQVSACYVGRFSLKASYWLLSASSVLNRTVASPQLHRHCIMKEEGRIIIELKRWYRYNVFDIIVEILYITDMC